MTSPNISAPSAITTVGGARLTFDATKKSQSSTTDNLADNRKARTNRGGRFRLQRITITPQPADFLLRDVATLFHKKMRLLQKWYLAQHAATKVNIRAIRTIVATAPYTARTFARGC
jgi:hypothetical protein